MFIIGVVSHDVQYRQRRFNQQPLEMPQRITRRIWVDDPLVILGKIPQFPSTLCDAAGWLLWTYGKASLNDLNLHKCRKYLATGCSTGINHARIYHDEHQEHESLPPKFIKTTPETMSWYGITIIASWMVSRVPWGFSEVHLKMPS